MNMYNGCMLKSYHLNWFQDYTELFVLRLVHGAVREDVKVYQLRKEQQEKSTVRYHTADYVHTKENLLKCCDPSICWQLTTNIF